jgi:hypothetical protein
VFWHPDKLMAMDVGRFTLSILLLAQRRVVQGTYCIVGGMPHCASCDARMSRPMLYMRQWAM